MERLEGEVTERKKRKYIGSRKKKSNDRKTEQIEKIR
jgi:hypothetical protein